MVRGASSQRAAAALIERVSSLNTINKDTPPERLYHFTDCAGLIGIFEKKTLWASLATAMNDPSEVRYGLDLARDLFRSGRLVTATLQLDPIVERVANQAAESRAYTVSFCGNLNLAGQWLHYGRSGSGAAVAFRSEQLTQAPYELCRILYEDEAQKQLIRGIVQTVDSALTEVLKTTDDEAQRDRLTKLAADLAAEHLWRAAPRLKHPAFRAEEEWRLITYEWAGPGVDEGDRLAGTTFFRASAGRVVPYKVLQFTTLPAFEVVLGSSCPMTPGDLGVRVLMQERLGAPLTVTVSNVPVRA